MSHDLRARNRPTRFLRIWAIFSIVYLVPAYFGSQGPYRNGHWLEINQHLVQVRNWLGEGGHPRSLQALPYPPQEDPGSAFWMDLARVPESGRPEAGRWQVGFPLGPAFLLLPLRLLLRGALATQWLGAILGALAVAAMDALYARWMRPGAVTGDRGPAASDGNHGQDDHRRHRAAIDGAAGLLRPSRNAFTLLAGMGTLWIWLVPNGEVYHFAQTVAATGLTLALLAANDDRPLWAGIAYAFALTSRPVTLLALPFVLAMMPPGSTGAGTAERLWGRRLRFALAPVLWGGILLGLNQARFGSPFEFGYRFMQMAEQTRARFLAHGQFSLAFLPDNLRWLILAPPVPAISPTTKLLRFPWLVSHPAGMGVFFVTPAYLAIFALLRRDRPRPRALRAAVVSLVLCTIPPLLYFNTGLVQWGGRFLLDAWPIWLYLTLLGLTRLSRRWTTTLIALSVLSNVWAAVLTMIGAWPVL